MTALLLALALAANVANPAGTGTCPTGQCVYQVTRSGPVACRPCGGGGGGGAGLPADPAACASGQYVRDQDASGVLACAQVQWSQLGAVPSTFAPIAHTHPGTDVTSQVASAAATPWAGLTGVPSTFTPSSHTHVGGDVTTAVANATAAASVPWSGVTSPPATYAPSAHTHVATTDLTATGTKNSTTFLRGDDTWAAPPGGGGAPTTAQYWVGAADGTLSAEKDLSVFTGLVKNTAGTPSAAVAGDLPGGPYLTSVTAHALNSATHSDVDAAATAANDVLIRDGTNTTWQHRALATTDLPAHLLMGAQHSDVDTAAVTAGDIVIRNAANTQWTHQAIGGANTVLHGGTTAPSFSAIADADLTGAVGVSHGGLGAAVTPAAGTIPYGSSGTAHAELAAGTAGQVLRSGGAGAPVWVGVQSCTSSATTTCTITVARSGCVPVCMNSTAVSTWVRGTVSTTTLTCTFSTSGTNTCNCLCP